jgi:hypothetical protein
MSRRTVVIAGSALAATIMAADIVGLRPFLSAVPVEPTFREAVLSVLDHLDDAIVVGQSFLEEIGASDDQVALETLVRERLRMTDHGTSGPAVRDLIRQRIDEDFESGEVVLLDGWLLSLTEATLFAYLAATSNHDEPVR